VRIKYHYITLLFVFLCIGGCKSINANHVNIPIGLSIEEHLLIKEPELDPLSFIPSKGSQTEILAKHQKERENTYPDNSFFNNMSFSMSVQLGSDKIVAVETFNEIVTSNGTFQEVTVQVTRNGVIIYSIPVGIGSPITSLRGLWTYSNHWILEIAYVNEHYSSTNEMSIESFGKIIQDGEILNDRYKYEETFGFQLMNGKPFYFSKRNGQIGISYDDKEIQLKYDQIPHYQCCSGSQLNPKVFMNMVAFFAHREDEWNYVEIGVY
jgi:hypothetical protein